MFHVITDQEGIRRTLVGAAHGQQSPKHPTRHPGASARQIGLISVVKQSPNPVLLAFTYDSRDMASPEELIAEKFNAYFANFNIRIEVDDIRIGTLREIRADGWQIRYRVDPDDAGSPNLEFYATHRMSDDRHVRMWAGRIRGAAGRNTRGLRLRPETPRLQ
jgi:hypothetical protein